MARRAPALRDSGPSVDVGSTKLAHLNSQTSYSHSSGPGIGARAGLALIRLYQVAISPLLPNTCKYYPSCSEYARRALLERGLSRGVLLALWRLLRCNPFSRGGYDPGPWAREELPASGEETTR